MNWTRFLNMSAAIAWAFNAGFRLGTNDHPAFPLAFALVSVLFFVQATRVK